MLHTQLQTCVGTDVIYGDNTHVAIHSSNDVANEPPQSDFEDTSRNKFVVLCEEHSLAIVNDERVVIPNAAGNPQYQ